MKIILVDDEQYALNSLQKNLKELEISEDIHTFDRSVYALNFAKNNKVDVAFLDISMPEMDGVELANELKKTNPQINIIFCTGYSEYMPQAIDIHASGYLLKPASKEDINKALNNLLNPVEEKMPHFYARTFGTFDFYVDGIPLKFIRSKSKELFAYLISIRGATANRKDLTAALFGDEYNEKTQNYLTKIYKDLEKSLEGVGANDILCKDYNTYSVNTSLFSCDLYDYDKGIPSAVNAYKGLFMSQYDWADFDWFEADFGFILAFENKFIKKMILNT